MIQFLLVESNIIGEEGILEKGLTSKFQFPEINLSLLKFLYH